MNGILPTGIGAAVRGMTPGPKVGILGVLMGGPLEIGGPLVTPLSTRWALTPQMVFYQPSNPDIGSYRKWDVTHCRGRI